MHHNKIDDVQGIKTIMGGSFLGNVNKNSNKNVDRRDSKTMMAFVRARDTVFDAIAELEWESIMEHQREGIEIAKTEGAYKGRKPGVVNETKS